MATSIITARGTIPHAQHYACLDFLTEQAFESGNTKMPESAGKIRFGNLGQHGQGWRFYYRRAVLDLLLSAALPLS